MGNSCIAIRMTPDCITWLLCDALSYRISWSFKFVRRASFCMMGVAETSRYVTNSHSNFTRYHVCIYECIGEITRCAPSKKTVDVLGYIPLLEARELVTRIECQRPPSVNE